MADFYPVASAQVLLGLHKAGELKHGFLVEAHQIMEDIPAYGSLFQATTVENIIVDNGAGILGKPCDPIIMSNSIDIVKEAFTGHIVSVIPDVYENSAATYQSVREFVSNPKHLDTRVQYMLVPQGLDENTFLWCLEKCIVVDEVDHWVGWIGIPRNVANNHGSRERAVKLVKALCPDKKIHLLGFSDNVADDVLCARMPEVESIDSSVPIRAAPRRVYMHEKREHGLDWWDKPYNEKMVANVKTVRGWVKGN